MSTNKQLQQHFHHKKHEKGIFHLALGAGGIYISYVVLSIFSQKLYNSTYESNVEFNQDGTAVHHKFTNANMIVWMSGLFCAIFGQLRSLLTRQRRNPISPRQSISLGILFAITMTTTNFALLYISYPTQVIARNSRYLFVVMVGSFFSRVSHKHDLKLPRHKLYVALIITIGVILFNVTKIAGRDKADQHAYPEEWKGYILLLVSMVADAFFCDTQAYCKSMFKPSANHLFTSANFYAFLLSALYAIATGSFLPGLKFILEHPQCLKQLALVCFLQVTGQISIYYIVANFKQHIFPLISATRKIITIVCSIFIFNHTLGYLQWVAVAIVFGGMIAEVYDEINERKKKGQVHTQSTSKKQIQADKEKESQKVE